MNPPFALKDDDEKEYRFINHALGQMTENGLLFCVLPCSVMYVSGDYLDWRRNLLLNHTLECVMTFPNDLFYPQASVEPIIIIVRAKVPHGTKNVLWARILDDGYRKLKRRRLPTIGENDLTRYTSTIRSYIHSQSTFDEVKGIIQILPIRYNEESLELIPQNYLDNIEYNEQEITTQMEKSLSDIYLQSLSEVFNAD
jgi:type I restriction-modification system DNA methylase subunit